MKIVLTFYFYKISRIPIDHVPRISKEKASEYLYANPPPTLTKKSVSK